MTAPWKSLPWSLWDLQRPARCRPGDLIVAVNDRLVTSVDDLHRLLSDLQDQPVLTLSLVRGTARLEADVRPAISR